MLVLQNFLHFFHGRLAGKTFKYTMLHIVYRWFFVVEVLSIRPSVELEKKLRFLSKMEDLSRPALAKKLLDAGAREELKNKALDLYRKRKISLGGAAELAGLSILEMHDLLNKHEIPLNISKKSILEDYRAALELKL